jgi:two-component system phosphate regulon sensor histidine kinase PhoR
MENKAEFLRLLKHQVKGPLTIIKGYLSFWESEAYTKFPPEKQREFILKAIIGVKRMDAIVNDTFFVLAIDDNLLKPFSEQADVKGLIEEIYKELKTAYEQKKITFDLNSPSNLQLIDSDKIYLKVVISKILDNAFKFNKENGSVKVSIEQDGNNTKIIIKDSGVGLVTEEKQQLFTKLYRGSLSLYVVKNLIDALKGTISVESEGSGNGSTFIVQLPNKTK